MQTHNELTRRGFLKTATLGTVAVGFGGTIGGAVEVDAAASLRNLRRYIVAPFENNPIIPENACGPRSPIRASGRGNLNRCM